MSNKPPFVGEKVKLGEVITQAPVKRCGDGSYPVLSMTMHDGIVEQKDRFKKAIASKDTKTYKVVYPGQLVVGFPIDEGVIYTQNYDFAGIMSPAYSVWNIDKSRVNPAYLELALHSPRSMAYYADKMRGTTARRRSITPDSLRELTIPLPAIEEQQGTLRVFNTVKAAQIACNAYYAKLDQLIKSRFVEMFGDPINNPYKLPIAKIEELVLPTKHAIKAGPFGSSLKKDCYTVSGYKIYGQEQVISGNETVGDYYISQEKYDSLISCKVIPGDVLISLVGTVGKVLVLSNEAEPGIINPRLIKITFNQELMLPHFFATLFAMDSVKKCLTHDAHGQTMDVLNLKIIKNLTIILPSVESQQSFLDFVAEVDKLRFVVNQQIDKLQTLYDSLAQEYFGD